MQSESQVQVTASMSDGLLTLQMNTRYGPIAFSYSPEAVEAGIAELVTEVLDGLENSDPTPLNEVSSRSDLPVKAVRESFEVYREKQRATFPMDAIEKFTPGNRAHAQGTLVQFSVRIVSGISLMLDQVAITSLTRSLPDLDQ